MSIFDRIFTRTLKPSVTLESARQEPGPMTVYDVWVLAKSQALSLDKDASLLLITSGTDLQADGRSFTWEFLFQLKHRNATILLTYGPLPGCQDIEESAIFVEKRITSPCNGVGKRLPIQFQDSPDIVAEFMRKGVDFVAGPTDMKIETGFSDDGRAQWVTYFWDKPIAVPFEKRAG